MPKEQYSNECTVPNKSTEVEVGFGGVAQSNYEKGDLVFSVMKKDVFVVTEDSNLRPPFGVVRVTCLSNSDKFGTHSEIDKGFLRPFHGTIKLTGL